jgi:hypothetical protein
MKQINNYLNNILNKKSKPLLLKNNIIKIIFEKTNIELKKEDISVVGDVLKIKTKPILKHKIGLNKNLILEEFSNKLDLKIKDLV